MSDPDSDLSAAVGAMTTTDADKSVNVAGALEALLLLTAEPVTEFELAQAVDEAVDDARLLGARNEMQDHLGVRGRLADRAVGHQLAAQRQAIGEVAIVADREAARGELGEQRLDIAQDGPAGGVGFNGEASANFFGTLT